MNVENSLIVQQSLSLQNYFTKFGTIKLQMTPKNKKKTKRQQKNKTCGPMPNVMAALLNIGGTLCLMTQFG